MSGGRRALALLALGLVASACALPVVSAGSYLPAGDVKARDLHASASLEVGRVLATPADVSSPGAVAPPDALKWQVSTWAATDLSLRYGLTDRIALEGQLKLSHPIDPFLLVPVGGSLAARIRLIDFGVSPVAVELGPRVVGIRTSQQLTQRISETQQQEDRWVYRAFGFELPAVVTWRLSPLVALTWAPFARAYSVRVWRDTTTASGLQLPAFFERSVVWSYGAAVSFALDVGGVQLAPGLAMERTDRPGRDAGTVWLLQPGVSFGSKF